MIKMPRWLYVTLLVIFTAWMGWNLWETRSQGLGLMTVVCILVFAWNINQLYVFSHPYIKRAFTRAK